MFRRGLARRHTPEEAKTVATSKTEQGPKYRMSALGQWDGMTTAAAHSGSMPLARSSVMGARAELSPEPVRPRTSPPLEVMKRTLTALASLVRDFVAQKK